MPVSGFLNIIDQLNSLFLRIIIHERWIILNLVIIILSFIIFESRRVIVEDFVVNSGKDFLLLTHVLAKWSPQEGVMLLLWRLPTFSLKIVDSCKVDCIETEISEKSCIGCRVTKCV